MVPFPPPQEILTFPDGDIRGCTFLVKLPVPQAQGSGLPGPGIIPTALFDDRFCPGAVGDGGQPLGLLGQAVPGVAASIEDGVVGIPNLVAEPVAAEVLPHILDGVSMLPLYARFLLRS